MNKLNNKGLSLIELLISIILISIVVVFMYRLLININNEMTNTDYAISNQQNRLEIIKTVENDLLNNEVTGITPQTGDTDIVTITYKDGSKSTLEINKTENKVTYTLHDKTNKTWTMKNCTINNITCIYANYNSDTNNSKSIYTISIMINTVNDNNSIDNNNKLDDIDITYVEPIIK